MLIAQVDGDGRLRALGVHSFDGIGVRELRTRTIGSISRLIDAHFMQLRLIFIITTLILPVAFRGRTHEAVWISHGKGLSEAEWIHPQVSKSMEKKARESELSAEGGVGE